MCVFDDVVEHCGEGAHKYLAACFPSFMDGVKEVCRIGSVLVRLVP